MGISHIDDACSNFKNLEELNVSQNRIKILENVPKSLKVPDTTLYLTS